MLESTQYVDVGQFLGQHQNRLLGNLLQVEQHQRVERVAKFVIGIESQHAAVELQILANEHRDRIGVFLDVADKPVDQIDRTDTRDQALVDPDPNIDSGARTNPPRLLAVEIEIADMGGDDQLRGALEPPDIVTGPSR